MGTVLRDISILWSLIHCIIMFMFLYKSRYSKKITVIFTVSVLAAIAAGNMSLLYFCGLEVLVQSIFATCVLPSLVLFFILAENKDGRFFFTFCLVDTTIYWVMILTNIIDDALGLGNYAVMLILRLVIYPVFEILIVKYLKKRYRDIQSRIRKGWGLFTALSALFYILLLLVTSYPTIMMERKEDYPLILLIVILMPVMYIIVFRVLSWQLKQHESDIEKQQVELQMAAVQEKLSAATGQNERIKQIKHDLKHYALLINNCLENGDLEKAKEHLKKFSGELDSHTLKSFCENSTINMVLSSYNGVAENKNISFVTRLSIPQKLTVSDIDLAVIISNALDNAIKAAEKCENKIIKIKSFTEDGRFYFEIKNTHDGTVVFENGMPASTEKGHGIGTKSIASIIARYDGIYSFITENEYFIFRFMI